MLGVLLARPAAPFATHEPAMNHRARAAARKNLAHLAAPATRAGWRARPRRARVDGPRHLLFAFCDHYEPLWGDAPASVGARARARVGRRLPAAGARVPRRRRAAAAPLLLLSRRAVRAGLPRAASPRWRARGFGEVELHLHHDGDTAAEAARRSRPLSRDRTPSTATCRATPTGGCATRSSTATGASPTRAATAAGAASTTSSRCCSRPAATPTSPSRRRPTSASPTSSTRSTGRPAISRSAAPTSTASARGSASDATIASS